MVVYLDASGDNTAETNFASFLRAVTCYGIPWRTRSCKGGENVLIARFMIEQRGTDRGSHICGRSVHNQRIERYWRDVFYGYTGAIYNVFRSLEEDGHLDIDNPKHLLLLHKIFIPRINSQLEVFRNSWNLHPLSTEHNYSPAQLMLMFLPPEICDLQLGEEDLENAFFICDNYEDINNLNVEMDTIISPVLDNNCLTQDELNYINSVDIMRDSSSLGYDIFVEAIVNINP